MSGAFQEVYIMQNKQRVTIFVGKEGVRVYRYIEKDAYRDQNAALSVAAFLSAKQGQ